MAQTRFTTRNAKIVATIGPASNDPETIAAMMDAGINVARINTTHADADELRDLIDTIYEVREQKDHPLGVMVDLRGPEVRTGRTETSVELTQDTRVRFVKGEKITNEQIGLSLDISNVEAGDRVLIDDGKIQTTVEYSEEGAVVARVDVGGTVRSRRGVNVPGTDLGFDVLTDADRAAIKIAAEKDADFLAASFIREREDVLTVREYVQEQGADIPIVSKIEQAQAVDNLTAIINESFGIMVARGDLGVECPLEDVPALQKHIIRVCRDHGVPVITATEMLETMITNQRPTRAEASDVANAVLDGTDAVMLSGETAVGDHPVTVIETMDRIVRRVEQSEEYADITTKLTPAISGSSTDALARSARDLVAEVGAAAITVASESGHTALEVAKYRPSVPIVAVSPQKAVSRRLALVWGITVHRAELEGDDVDDILTQTADAALQDGAAEHGDTVLTISGMMRELEDARTANILKVHTAAEVLATGFGITFGHGTGKICGRDSLKDGGILLVDDDDGTVPDGVEDVSGIITTDERAVTPLSRAARDLDIPMITGAQAKNLTTGQEVTVDVEHGVVYAGQVTHPEYRNGS